MRVFRGHQVEMGKDMLTWFSTDRHHAGYFGDVSEYDINVDGQYVLHADSKDEASFADLEIDEDELSSLLGCGGWELDDLVVESARAKGIEVLILKNWEGKGDVVSVIDAPWRVNSAA